MEDVKALTRLIQDSELPKHIKEGLLEAIALDIAFAAPSKYTDLVNKIAETLVIENDN